jgi:Arc/MetJ-type ribon-helix-helix transcriptional regulator
MPTIRVRISNEEKKELGEYGSLSEAVREGVRLYLQGRKTSKTLTKLRALQARERVKTTTLEELRLVKEDRNR